MMKALTTVLQKPLIMLDVWLGITYISNTKHVKKIFEELMIVAWSPTKGGNCCMAKDEKKQQQQEKKNKYTHF